MSEYKGFITRYQFVELRNKLRKIADTRGLENKIHHLYQPDTDMDDKICEDFGSSRAMIVTDLMEMVNNTLLLAIQIAKLEEEK